MALLLVVALPAVATPPEYATFRREQRTRVTMDRGDLMRIWVVYVGQGDGIVIQLPERFAREGREHGSPRETVDILVDGGSANHSDAERFRSFLEHLYAGDALEIEHAIITHHDEDHVLGLIKVLEDPAIGVDRIYHNGLASFAPGKRGLPKTGKPSAPGVFVYDKKHNVTSRTLGLLDAAGHFLPAFVMDDLDELRRAYDAEELQGVYGTLAGAIVSKTSPHPVDGFQRVRIGDPFLDAAESWNSDELSFEVLWPPKDPQKFGSRWGETINGNSVTFRLRYREFEMVFAGDLNEFSEQSLLQYLRDKGALERLRADVLKVPHHGSEHGVEEFYRAVSPVVSVASMGPDGARSKLISGSRAWQHPSSEVIRWLGGAHRVYLTELRERCFRWEQIDEASTLRKLKEQSHVLIETDGEWFRVVEVPVEGGDVQAPPTVQETRRSNGTRWIRGR